MEQQVRTLGQCLPAFGPNEITETDFSARSTVSLDLNRLRNLPARLDDETMGDLQAILACAEPPAEHCDAKVLSQVMRSLSILPRKADDEVTGDLRVALYRRMLGPYPTPVISFLCEEVLRRCRWFPSIAECIEIIADFPGGATDLAKAKQIAAARIRFETQARFEEAMAKLKARVMPQRDIDALPPFWRKAGETSGFLKVDPDGRYVARPER
jgi:hypothetical protein